MGRKFRGIRIAVAAAALGLASSAPAVAPLAPEVPVATEPAPALPAGADPRDLRLRDALALALARSPDLASFAWQVRAAEARLLQAGVRPNPALDLKVEDVGVSGATRGIDQAELTVELSQLVELGGKRSSRIDRAERERELAGWDYETRRVDILTRAAQAFVAVLVAQEQLSLSEDGVRLAGSVVAGVSARVRAGSSSSVELVKAEVALASARIESEERRGALESARRSLAATWGSPEARFDRAVGSLEPVAPLPALADLKARIEDNPDLARWSAEILERRAAVRLEEARAVPDVTARGGYRRLFDPDENTFVVGLSVPLPIFDRNQGGILEAESRLAQARSDRQSAESRVAAALADAHLAAETSLAQVTTLRSQVLPGARRVFETLSEGYREGRYSQLEVLDAQRTLIAARAQTVRALGDYHRAVAAVERLIGAPLGGGSATAPGGGKG